MDENFFIYLAKLIQKKLRDEKLTLKQAAGISKISPSTLSRLSHGETAPDMDSLINLSKWLNISIDQLLQVPHQLTLDHAAHQMEITVHFRGKRRKLDSYPEEVNELLVKIIRLAYEQFQGDSA